MPRISAAPSARLHPAWCTCADCAPLTDRDRAIDRVCWFLLAVLAIVSVIIWIPGALGQ